MPTIVPIPTPPIDPHIAADFSRRAETVRADLARHRRIRDQQPAMPEPRKEK